MDNARYLECLAADATRLRDVAAGDLGAPVPSCPDWTVTDLVRHVAMVYLHKVECMRHNAMPKPWPPDFSGEPPLALFDRAYADLIGEFDRRDPGSPSYTWFTPDQTVGFWVRRMAQETVIHRLDAELALGVPAAPVPADLAVDGVDEVLVTFLAFAAAEWPEDFAGLLDDTGEQAVAVLAGDRAWTVRLAKDGITVSAGAGDAAASVSGVPDAVLGWLWRRSGDEAVTREGDPAAIATLRGVLGAVTQ